MFAAILFISAVFVIVTNKSSISLRNFEKSDEYLDNYVYEAKMVMNNARYHDSDVQEALKNLTEAYMEYAESKNVDVGVLYIFTEDGRMYFGNYLKEPVLIKPSSVTLQPEDELEIDFEESIDIEYGNETYNYEFSGPNQIEFKTLLVKKNV